jgi:hypothetical protein
MDADVRTAADYEIRAGERLKGLDADGLLKYIIRIKETAEQSTGGGHTDDKLTVIAAALDVIERALD